MPNKLLIASILILLSAESFSQKLVLDVNYLPVREGKIYENPESSGHGCSIGDGAFILTCNDSCFSLTDAIVCAVFDLGNDATIILRRDSVFITYMSFKPETVTVKKGDSVRKRAFLGLLNPKENRELNELLVMITKDLRYYSFNQIIQFIRENMNIADCENAISYE
jgi:hypothetical protein